MIITPTIEALYLSVSCKILISHDGLYKSTFVNSTDKFPVQ
jgi:hypothetical protein